MPDFINLTCPKCGGKLQITSDIDRFSCGYCGNELILQRSGGAITVAPVVDGLKRVQAGTDKTASELAIVRLEGEISKLSQQRNSIPVNSSYMVLLFILITGMFLLAWVFEGMAAGFGNVTAWVLFLAGIGFGFIAYFINLVISSSQKVNIKLVASIDQTLTEKRQELEKHRNIVRNG